ncbi:ROK family transcriptional regulator [Peribacillus kribbensis]|uniref:ROK family transcriptional regulator n=1 Tax=Peribacillus kribbensis TaxID=356658 RepID=UPI00041A2D8D|nr:ROK family protein [Peribacillus kribbensis]
MKEKLATPKSLKGAMMRGIRTTLLKLGSATKVELSETLGISFPTISKFLSEMESEGEILLAGLDDSSGGRRAKRYIYNPEYMLGLAIFLEKTETNYTIFNCVGESKEDGKAESVLMDSRLEALTRCIEGLLARFPKICSIAIGVPGSVDHGRVFYIPGYEQLQDFDLKGYYEDRFSVPVIVENDMNAAVLGFHHNGGMKEKQSLIYLYSGQNGPGAGIMVNGDIVRGRSFFSGEVSFVPLYDERNFREALEKEGESKKLQMAGEIEVDAVSRLVASFTAMINPHTIIFCKDEVEDAFLEKIAAASAAYIPSEHLPELIVSDWKKDYLFGLQHLGLNLMLS